MNNYRINTIMSPSEYDNTQMPLHPDDLNKAWVCHTCNSLFIFRSDVKLHNNISGHRKFAVFDLATGKLVKNNETITDTVAG